MQRHDPRNGGFARTSRDESGYKVKKDVRDLVVFAVQNVIKDPPFTKLDLLSCRNLLIYLEMALQDRLIPVFHYALKKDGVLFLSTSESITSRTDLFSAIDRKWKFYRAIHTGSARVARAGAQRSAATDMTGATAGAMPAVKAGVRSVGNIAALSAHALLKTYAPASVTTDAMGNIQYVHGETGRYLRPAPGVVSNNVVDMAREGLQRDLRAAIDAIATRGEPTLSREVSVKTDAGFSAVRLSVRVLTGERGEEGLLLISFEDVVAAGQAAEKPRRGKRAAAASAEAARIQELERELAYARDSLQANIEEQQVSSEELKSTNEELQSTNEELQSANEELETSKEELQSLNEETVTVNAELNAKIEQLTGVQNDLKNLMDSINTGALFLDHRLVLRRYTPAAVKVYRLIATDVGRPLSDIKSNLGDTDLQADLQAVLDTLIPIEREVRSTDGGWYLARIQPYRTLDNVIEGVVLTLTSLTEFKLATEEARRATAELAATQLAATQLARELAENIVDTIVEPLLVLDSALQVVLASRSFYRHFEVTQAQTVGYKIYDLGNGQWAIPALRELLEAILPRDQVI